MSVSKGKGKEKEKILPSSNWLALQKQLSSEKKPSSSSKIRKSSSTSESNERRKRRKLNHDHGRPQRHDSPSFPRALHPSEPASTSAGGTGPSGSRNKPIIDESQGALQQMVLGHLEYAEHQKLPGKYLALDCEMVGVGIDGSESSLARVSLINFYGYVVLDEFVRQKERVVDYRTQWSGIRERDMVGAKPFEEVQKKVAELLDGSILVGHAVHNDLKALLLSHPWPLTRDTQHYAYKFGVTKQKRAALRNLVKQELNLTIQSGEHSSVTDARATMAVYRLHKKEWEKGSRQLPLTASMKVASAASSTTVTSTIIASSSKRRQAEATESGDEFSSSTSAADESSEDEDDKLDKIPTTPSPVQTAVGVAKSVSTTRSQQKAQVFPGGGRKGVSSGVSTVIRRVGDGGTTKVKTGKGNGVGPGSGVNAREKTKSDWWKQLPGGVSAGGGSKGSITVGMKR